MKKHKKADKCKFGCCRGVKQMARPKTADEYLEWFKRYFTIFSPTGADPEKHSFFQLPKGMVAEVVGALWNAVHGRPLVRASRKKERAQFGKDGRIGDKPERRNARRDKEILRTDRRTDKMIDGYLALVR